MNAAEAMQAWNDRRKIACTCGHDDAEHANYGQRPQLMQCLTAGCRCRYYNAVK